MNILVIPNNRKNACYDLRNRMPMEYLEKLGHSVRYRQEFDVMVHPKKGKFIDGTPIDWADVVVMNRHYDTSADTIMNLMAYAKEQGKKVVYETDDLLESLDASNPMYEDIRPHVNQVKRMIALADVVTTTVEPLADELRKKNRNVVVLPNCIDEKEWKERKQGNKRVRVGWAGGSSHAADLLLVIDTIRELHKTLPFDFVIYGLAPMQWREYVAFLKGKHEKQLQDRPDLKPAEWYRITMELDKKLDFPFIHLPFTELGQYKSTLANLNFDIGICPLVDTRFNRCKSAIKFYEYAMVGTATLASAIPPYKGETSYVAKKPIDWKKKLSTLITDETFRYNLARSQKEWVIKNRNIEANARLWEDVYKQ